MATNDITLYIPPTEEEVMLIQPNNVTFGQYSVTEWQENLLTLISDQIQQHMTREKQLPKDLFNQPVVEIKCDEAGGKNNKSKVLKEAIAMMRKNFSFRWVHPNIHQTVETFGGGDNDGTQHQRHKPGSPDAQPLGDPFPALLRYGCRRYKVRGRTSP